MLRNIHQMRLRQASEPILAASEEEPKCDDGSILHLEAVRTCQNREKIRQSTRENHISTKYNIKHTFTNKLFTSKILVQLL